VTGNTCHQRPKSASVTGKLPVTNAKNRAR
jgi:hypothetical protein